MTNRFLKIIISSLVVSMFAFSQSDRIKYEFCYFQNKVTFKNKVKSTLILDFSNHTLEFSSPSAINATDVFMYNVRSTRIPVSRGAISFQGSNFFSGPLENNVNSVVRYEGSGGIRSTYYLITYYNGDTGLYIFDLGAASFVGRASSCYN